jgi:predicted HTH domain antitoxin
VVVVNRGQPEALLVHLDDQTLLAESGVRLALATALYRDGSLSLGQAARFADVPLAAFVQHVSRIGIAVIRGAHAADQEEVQTVRSWRKKGSSRRTRFPLLQQLFGRVVATTAVRDEVLAGGELPGAKELLGRGQARALGVPVTGLGGILLAANRARLVKRVRPLQGA